MVVVGFLRKPILSTADPISCGQTVSLPPLGQEFDSRCGGFFFFGSSRVSCAPAQSDPDHRLLSPSKMYTQRLTRRHVVAAYRGVFRAQQLRCLVTTPPPPEIPQPPPKPYRYEKAEPKRSWAVQKIRANPTALKIVQALGRAMGYGSTKQVAGRRTLAMYERVCAFKASEDRVFWQEGEQLPSTRSLLHCGLTLAHLSLRFASNIPILVHHNQPPRLAIDRSVTRTPTTSRHKPHSRSDRPLLLGYRRPSQGRAPTYQLRNSIPNRLLCTSIHPGFCPHRSHQEETRPGTRQARQTTDADPQGTVGRSWDVT